MRPSLRSSLTIGILLVFLHGCGTGRQAEPPVFATREQALVYYIESLRAGDLEGIVEVTYPPATEFYLPGPARILDYKITDKRMLTKSAATEYNNAPPRSEYHAKRAGDVALDVREVRTDNIENMFTYWFRKIGDSWKLYAWSAGAPTTSATNADRSRDP